MSKMMKKAALAMISEEAYEQLQQILEKLHKQTFTPGEVREVGDELLGFYRLLVDIENRINSKKRSSN